ncbi:MAG: hypothetical protein CM15mV6_2510 [uncultured marine virus]|nr:MAG: hypothetical protein CM15mV6_2510 [uncultured marine virus]
MLILTDPRLVLGETVTGVDTDNNVLTATIDDADGSVEKGSKVITNQYELNQAQNPFFYDVSRLVRKPKHNSSN